MFVLKSLKTDSFNSNFQVFSWRRAPGPLVIAWTLGDPRGDCSGQNLLFFEVHHIVTPYFIHVVFFMYLELGIKGLDILKFWSYFNTSIFYFNPGRHLDVFCTL